MQDAVQKEPKDVSLEGDFENVPCWPPFRVYVEGSQTGIDIVCEEMVYDWWRIIGKAWYYVQLYRLSGAMRYLQKRKRYCEYSASPAMMKIFDEKMENMLKNGVIVEAPYEELLWINSCHDVPKANGDMRLVMDMTKVNKFMKPITFKMESTSTLPYLIVKNDYAISFALKEAYNHVPVYPSMQPLLALAWRGNCYKCLGMPFELNDAPRVFTMIMRV
jgi:hypothetical protein